MLSRHETRVDFGRLVIDTSLARRDEASWAGEVIVTRFDYMLDIAGDRTTSSA